MTILTLNSYQLLSIYYMSVLTQLLYIYIVLFKHHFFIYKVNIVVPILHMRTLKHRKLK